MLRGPLAAPGFRGQFSGHETFTLRYGWLNKAFDAVAKSSGRRNGNLFSKEDAIADFGVGKNMVSAIKHWALTAGIIEEVEVGYQTTELGNLLMGEDGLDPYLESPTTLWLIHWQIASNAQRATTWYWALGLYSALTFDQERLTTEILQLAKDHDWKRISPTTIKRDVECFIKTYSVGARRASSAITEDSLESPLAELGLMKSTGFRGSYQFQRGTKPSLPDQIFALALNSFWPSQTAANTLSVEAITYEPGSPGRVFKLDEDGVVERLIRIDQASDGSFRWTDTAGLSQVQRTEKPFSDKKALRRAFQLPRPTKKAA